MPNKNPYFRPLLLLLFLTTAFRLIYINFIDLVPDEAYYWDISRRLQLSYYDHPPMLMYLISLSTNVLGNTPFAVRLPSVIISGAVTILVYLIGKEMFGERVGFYSSLVANTVLIYSVGGILATIDTPFALFWLLALYFGVKALKTGEGMRWYLKDVALGLGMLSKYIMVLFVPAFLLFLVLSKEHRRWLRRKEPYIGSIVALLIFSPVIIWNAQNGWASFKFQLSHGLEVKNRAGLRSLFEYIGSQAGILSPFLFMACLWAMWKGFAIWIRERDWRYLYLSCMSAFVVLFFGYSSVRAKVEGNWPMSAYFAAIISLTSLYFKSSWKRKKGVASVVIGMAVTITFLAHLQGAVPLVKLKKDPTDELHGWKEMGVDIGKALDELEQKKELAMPKGYFILGTSHQFTAELSFYIPSKPYVYELAGEGKFNQYNMWEGPPAGSDAALIMATEKSNDPYIRSLFDDMKEYKKVELKRGEKVIKTYSIFICRNFHGFKDKVNS